MIGPLPPKKKGETLFGIPCEPFTWGAKVARPFIDPFRIKRRGPRYTIEQVHFREDEHPEGGFIRIYDLHAEGDTLDELLENAHYWRTNDHGSGGRKVEAEDAEAQNFITLAYFRAQEGERE